MRSVCVGLGFLVCVSLAGATSASEAVGQAMLFLSADPIQPAGEPVVFRVTLYNPSAAPIRYWWCGPAEYPPPAHLLVYCQPVAPGHRKIAAPLFNGQSSDGAGRIRMILPGSSISMPAVILPLAVGRYGVLVTSDGSADWPAVRPSESIQIEIRDDAKLLAARFDWVTAGVRSGNPFAQYISAGFPRPQTTDALRRDLLGGDIIAAERAMDGLWGEDGPGEKDAGLVAEALRRHTTPPADSFDFAMMDHLLEMARRFNSLEMQTVIAGTAAARTEGPVHELAISTLDRLQASWRERYRSYVIHYDPADLGPMLALARSQDPHARILAYRALAAFPKSPEAIAAIRAGTADADPDVGNAAHQSLNEVTPDGK